MAAAASATRSEGVIEQGAMDITDACEFVGVGRSFLYTLMESGSLRFIKLGRRRLIPRLELQRLLADGLVGTK
jgi:excisionase family DNA binding protein